eukprot:m51a1_g3579 hypothetical protein (220) ;mRNA; r:1118841-1119714
MSARTDGRQADQLRPLDCEESLLTRCDGSSRFSHGHTCYMAAVYGPAEAESHAALPDRAIVTVSVRPRTNPAAGPGGPGGPLEREWEDVARRAYAQAVRTQLHPRAAVSVVLQCVADDGAALAVALNAGVAALVDAGVQMASLPTFAACAVMPDGAEAKAVITMGFEAEGAGGMVVCCARGLFADAELARATVICRAACGAVSRFLRAATHERAKTLRY